MSLLLALRERNIVHQVTDPALDQALEKKMVLYAGFDPSADSLHVGNLVPLIGLRRFQLAGHRPIAVLGGATGMVGDPSGKSRERDLLSREALQANLRSIRSEIERILDTSQGRAKIVDNMSWYEKFGYLDFLREVGKHFTVNHMLAKDSVKTRLHDRDQGISFTEFSYMLLQAYDFYVLAQKDQCQLQIGGSDQWGNITAGIELIRRMRAARKETGPEVFGLTYPLIKKADGSKFGKTETGSVWLDPKKTSPYQFYQFFVRTADADVIHYLEMFTFFELDEIESLKQSLTRAPEKREAQIALARAVTTIVHGADEVKRAEAAASALYSTEIRALDHQTLKEVFSEAPSTKKDKDSLQRGIKLLDLLVETKLCKSKGASRKDISSGGIYVNNERISDVEFELNTSHLLGGRSVLLRKGKKNYHLVSFG